MYVLRHEGANWVRESYVKASNSDAEDVFGQRIAVSGDGSTFVVCGFNEGSNAAGIDGDQTDNSYTQAGAAYVFRVRD